MAETESDRNKAIAALLAELRRQGIRDDRVLAAIGDVPRERFVPTASGDQAWANAALPIGAGQTISQPYIVALMTAALRLSGDERVLEIGTGSGYQAAILAALAAEVVTVERHASLAVAAESLLRDLGYDNVRVVVGDGTIGWPECAPYDRIIVTAGAPRVPAPLIAELSQDGGRLVIPVGEPDNQVLLVVERHGDRTTEQPLGPVRFVPLIGRAGWEVPVR
ncbi:MAG: protein-L-isoaspartate(D-aspartate) O-methyltransferase [Thermomicrobiales bacterium]|jgi:protein-L-isoaspartate(D-aspartate) O-methyltransferase|nr:protein-L-isoaspartate(D-aspartate) O-methyltransferase [Thermomicrobiales bacterium]